ncbi:MAG: hypothetical protein F6K65_32810 [Moorea sp. SIO3C2]|nr:hypothetical protein [Moorena sp. SIO3C2]
MMGCNGDRNILIKCLVEVSDFVLMQSVSGENPRQATASLVNFYYLTSSLAFPNLECDGGKQRLRSASPITAQQTV